MGFLEKLCRTNRYDVGLICRTRGYLVFCITSKIDSISTQRDCKGKLRLDLFEKRYKVFETVFPYYDVLVYWKGTDEQKETKAKFFMAYQQSRFLFGEDVEKIFRELLDAGVKVVAFKENSQVIKHDTEFFHTSYMEANDIMLNFFPERLGALKLIMSPYMDFQRLRLFERNA